jgi:hypothetical protein
MNYINLASRSLYIADKFTKLIPGIEKLLLYYFDKEEKKFVAKLYTHIHDEFYDFDNISTEVYNKLDLFIKEKGQSQWISNSYLGFDLQYQKKIQTDVFDEKDNNILLQKIKSEKESAFDLLFFYFKPDATNFSLQKDINLLSTESKAILATLINNNINILSSEFNNHRSQITDYKAYINRLARELTDSKKKNIDLSENYFSSILEFVKFKLKEVGVKFGYDFILDKSAINQIKSLKTIDFIMLSKALEEAAKFAVFSNSSDSNSIISIFDWHLNIKADNHSQNGNLQDVNKAPEGRYRTTYLLLDRIEKAARKVKSNNEKLTSSRVGQAMDEPISAPAISDALRKHKKQINSLFSHYPNNWTLIRTSFKPVLNIVNNSLSDDYKKQA